MEFKTTVIEMKKALNRINSIVNHNSPLLPYRYIKVGSYGDKIEFKVFNEYTVASSFMNCYDAKLENISVFVLAKHLMSLIGGFGSGEIMVKITQDSFVVVCGKSKYKLPTLDQDIAKEALDKLEVDYYTIDKKNFESILSNTCLYSLMDISSFKACYSSINHCLSKTADWSMQNICICDDKMIACDGVRGAAINFDSDLLPSKLIMIHKDACDCILNIDDNKEIEIYFNGQYLFGKSQDFYFVTTVDNEYPYEPIKKIIYDNWKEKFDIHLTFEPSEFIEKLNRVLIFADQDTNSINIGFNDKNIVLKIDHKTIGSEEINLFKNENNKTIESFYINGKNLKEALSKVMSKATWLTMGSEDIQYIWDGNLLQFFYGLEQ